MVAQPERSDRDLFHRPHDLAHVDVLANAKSVIDQEKDPRHDVFHKRLRAKSNGETDDPSPSQQRRDVDTQFAQDCQHGHGRDCRKGKSSQQRQQRTEARAALPAFVAGPTAFGF